MNELINILLIEDNPGDALLIKEALKDSVYINTTLFYAETISEAIKFNNEEIVLILVDLNLPDSDGIETVREVRMVFPNAAIIVLTGLDNDEISFETVKEGAQNYLNKGEITGKILEKTIRFSLERHLVIQKLLVAEKELQHNKFILEKAQEMAHVGSWVYNIMDEKVELSNETYKIFGLNPANFDKNADDFFSMVHDEDKQLVKSTMSNCIAEKKLFELKHRIVCKQGNIKWVNSQSEIYYNDNGIPLQIIGTLQDITEKKEAESKILKANRLYDFISQVNQTIVHVKDEQTLFDNICNLAVEFGKFKEACIGLYAQRPKIINFISFSGLPESDMNLMKEVKFVENSPSDIVLTTKNYHISNKLETDISLQNWWPLFKQLNCKSYMVLPFVKFGKVIGTFNLAATEINFFDKEEIELLIDVTANISFALELFEQTKKHQEIEKQIAINEQRFRSLIEKNNDMITLSNENGELLYGSPSIEKGLGYTANDLKNVKVLDFIHPDDVAIFAEKRQQLTAFKGKSFNSQHRLLNKKGEYVWCDVTLTNMLGETGIDAIVSNFRDISEKKLFELQLQKSEAFNRGTLNALNSHIAVIDKNGTIIAVNDSWNKFGIENGATVLSSIGVGSNYFDVCEKASLTDETSLDILQGIKDVMNEKLEVFNFEYPCDSPTTKKWFATRVLKFDSEEPMAVLAHLDITERKQAEIERIQMTNDLIKRNTNLEQFSYIVSHNLRAPVANIIGLTNVAVDKNLDLSMKNEIIESLSYSVGKLDDVINDLNNILSTKQKIDEKKEVILFSEMVNDVQISIENLMVQENVTINCDFSEINEISSIKSYFNSIFYNLISNSIKYHQPNIPPVIHIFSKLNNNKIELHFKDNGMGIDLTKKGDQVFGLYKRFHLNIGGKGMGLFMIKTQIESLGGKINIQSEVNNGTTFIIEFDRYE